MWSHRHSGIHLHMYFHSQNSRKTIYGDSVTLDLKASTTGYRQQFCSYRLVKGSPLYLQHGINMVREWNPTMYLEGEPKVLGENSKNYYPRQTYDAHPHPHYKFACATGFKKRRYVLFQLTWKRRKLKCGREEYKQKVDELIYFILALGKH